MSLINEEVIEYTKCNIIAIRNHAARFASTVVSDVSLSTQTDIILAKTGFQSYHWLSAFVNTEFDHISRQYRKFPRTR